MDQQNWCKMCIPQEDSLSLSVFRASSFVFSCMKMFWWPERRRHKGSEKETNRELLRETWRMITSVSSSESIPASHGEVTEREGDKTQRKLILKEMWERAVDWWSCKFSPDGVRWYQELRSLSRVPFVSAWLQFINLRDANSHISPLTPPSVLCSAGVREEHPSCLTRQMT